MLISWNNKYVIKDRVVFWFLVLFYVFWVPLTCYATTLIFTGKDPILFVIWCFFGWAGMLLIPYQFIQRRWHEWIEVDLSGISTWRSGFLAGRKKRTVNWIDVAEIGIGYAHHFVGDGYEVAPTLNILERKGKRLKRHLLAYWLARENKEFIYEKMQQFSLECNLNINFNRY